MLDCAAAKCLGSSGDATRSSFKGCVVFSKEGKEAEAAWLNLLAQHAEH
jgi:hypothetical protein